MFFSFNLITDDICTMPEKPLGSSESDVACDDSDAPRFTTCTPTCGKDYAFSVEAPEFYTCGPLGSFNVDNKQLSFRFPRCSRMLLCLNFLHNLYEKEQRQYY